MENYKDQQTIIPYLMLENAGRFMEFVQTVFNGQILFLNMDDDNRTVLNAEIKIGHTVILLSDAKDKYGIARGNFFIYVKDADETFSRACYHGASVVKEVSDMDYGRSGGIEDPFGNTWWLTSVSLDRC